MKMISFSMLFIALFSFAAFDKTVTTLQTPTCTDSIPYILGNFEDDYGIHYKITDSVWAQGSGIKYHILQWNKKEQCIIARNDNNNPTEAGLYTRIDYMQFENMQPWTWGFCYTVYKAKTDSDARNALAADRNNPRKGCNGYPFSRMKKID
ncbi:MAG: hypothetical protein QM737_23025 [Ferruginibacter sp.]